MTLNPNSFVYRSIILVIQLFMYIYIKDTLIQVMKRDSIFLLGNTANMLMNIVYKINDKNEKNYF